MVKPDAASRCSRKDRLEVHFVDGTVVRAHQHAAGAKGTEAQALGRSHGGFSTKVHVKAEGYGKPMYFVLTGGERHETVASRAGQGWKESNDSEGPPQHRSR